MSCGKCRVVNVVIVMGVSGCGKSTVGKAIAPHLNATFYDADDFHPPENITKMSQGIPLTDRDRAPWLQLVHTRITKCVAQNQGVVFACSALKQSYREQLRGDLVNVQFVYLRGDFAVLWGRLSQRSHHFMKAEMLESQLATLEEPIDAISIEIDQPLEEMVNTIGDRLRERYIY